MEQNKQKDPLLFEAGFSMKNAHSQNNEFDSLFKAVKEAIPKHEQPTSSFVHKIEDPWSENYYQDRELYEIHEASFETKLDVELRKLDSKEALTLESEKNNKEVLLKKIDSNRPDIDKTLLSSRVPISKLNLNTKSYLQLFGIIFFFEVFRMFYVVFMAL